MQDMQRLFEIPKCVVDSVLELKDLVEKNPIYIPTTQAAKFLRVSPESLKAFIEENPQFAMGWRKDGKANRGFNIPTAKFYLWYMGLTGFNQFIAQNRR